MYMQPVPFQSQPPLTPSQIADLRLAASKLSGPERRSFEAEMTLKYCQGNPLKAEAVFGWGRQTVALGLAEKRSGVICLGAQGRPVSSRWGGASPQALCTLDLERCPWCHPGTLGLIATIPYRPVIRKLLRPLKLAAGPPDCTGSVGPGPFHLALPNLDAAHRAAAQVPPTGHCTQVGESPICDGDFQVYDRRPTCVATPLVQETTLAPH